MSKQSIIAIEFVLLCIIVLSFLADTFLKGASFLAIFAIFAYIALFIKIRRFPRAKLYLAYLSILLTIVLTISFSMQMFRLGKVSFDLFIASILALAITNIMFRVVFGRNTAEGIVLLSDDKLAVVELDFDLFAGIAKGKYVVETPKKLEKGAKVKVSVKQKFFQRVPERVIL